MNAAWLSPAAYGFLAQLQSSKRLFKILQVILFSTWGFVWLCCRVFGCCSFYEDCVHHNIPCCLQTPVVLVEVVLFLYPNPLSPLTMGTKVYHHLKGTIHYSKVKKRVVPQPKLKLQDEHFLWFSNWVEGLRKQQNYQLNRIWAGKKNKKTDWPFHLLDYYHTDISFSFLSFASWIILLFYLFSHCDKCSRVSDFNGFLWD